MDPELFFPESTGTGQAKRICKVCPVIEECLEYALVHRENYGIWGGATVRERMAIRRKRGMVDTRGRKPSSKAEQN